MTIYYIDGQFVPADEARIPLNDLALLRGYGVFDFLRTYNGHPFHLNAHIERLKTSARQIQLKFPWSTEQICAIVAETLTRNALAESTIRILVTGGSSSDFITPDGPPRLIVMVSPHKKPPAHWYETGVKIVTTRFERQVPDAKCTNYIPAIMALIEARKVEAIEALYVDRTGHVLEGTTSNLFAFVNDRLITPEAGVLPGITRRVIFEIAGNDFPIDSRSILLPEVLGADEIFITASNKEVVPVIAIDTQVIGDGCPGAKTREMMRRFNDYTRRHAAAKC